MSDVRVFDVWLMWVEFPDHPGIGKTRPVVVCEVSDDDVRGIVLTLLYACGPVVDSTSCSRAS